jgi:hypothetical protein
LRAEGDEGALVPVDDGSEGLDDEEGTKVGMAEGGDGGVAEAEAAHDDVEGGGSEGVEGGEAEICKGYLYIVEEAGHEEGVAEFDFEDFEAIEGEEAATAEDEIAQGGFAVVELGEVGGHGGKRDSGASPQTK